MVLKDDIQEAPGAFEFYSEYDKRTFRVMNTEETRIDL